MNKPVMWKRTTLLAVSFVAITTFVAACTTAPNTTPKVDAHQDSVFGNKAKQVNHYLADLLRKHGVKDVQESDQYVTIPNANIRFKGGIYRLDVNKNGATAELDIRLLLPDGRQLVEYPAAMGKDPDAAIGMALANFCMSTFDPIYGAFINSDDKHVWQETWTINGQSRKVYAGNGIQMILGKTGQKPENQQAAAKAREWWLSQFKEIISQQKIDGREHWSKFFVIQDPARVIEREITFDSEAAPAMNELLAKRTCPTSLVSMYTVKQFIVIGKSVKTEAVGAMK